MSQYPYFQEPTHDVGTVTVDATNKARTTAVSNSEGRLVVDVTDHIFLLEPKSYWVSWQ